MTMRKASFILILLGFLSTWSCHKEVVPGAEDIGSGTGSIELRLDSGKAINLQTKATNLEEGLEFNNVLVILVNNSGNVVANQYVTESSPVSEKTVSFNGLLPGDYHVYAYANIDATAWQKTGSDLISAKESTLDPGTSFSTFVDRELASLTGTDVPSDPSTSMLLTGHKEIAVGLARVTETLDLLRPVVRFKVSVRNNTPFPVNVNELRFSHFNPDKAYLLDHRDASGVPAVPSGVTYRAMPDFSTSAGDDNSVAANAEEVIYQRLLYENAYSGTYKIFTTLTLDRSSQSMSNLELSLGDHPFEAIRYETLSQMDEGEQVNVLVFNPQISALSGRLFAYISTNNYIAWESAGYDNYNKYYIRAEAIYNQTPYTYDSYNGSDTDGYSAWDGVSSDPKEDNTFNYTGARNQYFHRLSKSGGLYTIDGLAINNANTGTVSGSSISNLRIENGAVVSGKNPADLNGKLVRFINNANGQYLKANSNWTNNKPKQKESNLRWEGGGTNQDRQFMLFGKYKAGGPLKRILKANNKEVPLTYMARNEEINVIINVYYSDKTGLLQFVVDNSTWGTATTSSHTFN